MLKYIVKNPRTLKNISKIPLLSRFFILNIESLNNVQDQSFYRQLFRHLRYGDVSGKETYFGRFADLDDQIIPYFDNNLSIHDVGCSTGVTSLDLYESCQKNNINVDLTISDKYTKIYFSGSFFRKVYDGSGNLKQIYLGRLLLDKNISNYFILSKIFFYPFALFCKKKPNHLNLQGISLMDPSVRTLFHSHAIKVVDYDIFFGTSGKFDFVRCMNVLNRSYFPDELIITGLHNLVQSLHQGGMLLVGRTDELKVNKATLFKKVDGCLVVLRHFTGGAEIFDIIEKNFSVKKEA